MAAAPEAVAETASAAPVLQQLSAALRKGQKKKVLQLCQEALDSGIAAEDILSGGLVDGMTRLGEDFSASRVFVPEMLVAARCMNAATELLKPLFTRTEGPAGRVCLGSVRGDMHDIGKNLVKIMMEGSGLEVVDLGVDVAPETFLHAARDQHCGIIACSALLTTTMPEMRHVVELVRNSDLSGRVRVMVGGAPITQAFCDEIGADAYTPDAAKAASAACSLLHE
ncbi:MAG: cobalamin-binding protein [Clostridiales bacterium]|nr:cobalamin-binding protein [Clostridiales bacterium]